MPLFPFPIITACLDFHHFLSHSLDSFPWCRPCSSLGCAFPVGSTSSSRLSGFSVTGPPHLLLLGYPCWSPPKTSSLALTQPFFPKWQLLALIPGNAHEQTTCRAKWGCQWEPHYPDPRPNQSGALAGSCVRAGRTQGRLGQGLRAAAGFYQWASVPLPTSTSGATQSPFVLFT